MLPPFIYPPMQLFYREKGDRSLPPLVILHGLWGVSENWLPTAEKLSGEFHVLLPDFRNHGHSPHADDHTYRTLANDIQEWIRSLQLPERPYIAGHSMGGKCLMHLLLQSPDTALKAAIIDIAPKCYEETEGHRRIAAFMRDFTFPKGESRTEVHKRIRSHVKEERICQILFKNIGKGTEGLQWKINIPAILKALPSIAGWDAPAGICETPTLFIKGGESDYLQAEDAATIKRLFTNADFLTIPDAGHWIHTQQPEALADALKRYFLQ